MDGMKVALCVLLILFTVYCGIWVHRGRVLKKKSMPELHNLIRKSTYLQGEMSRLPTLDGNWIHREELPDALVLLLLSSEDHRFYEHHGVDFFRIFKILQTPRVSRSVYSGGSTLTQQLVKTIWGSCDRTIWNKIHEMVGVLIVESLLKKDEILELYVNCIMWSPNTVGLSSAVRTLFGKQVDNLQLDDMILLVAGLPNPETLAEYIMHDKPNRRLLNRIQRLTSEAVTMGIFPESNKGTDDE
jgi:membrane peptidoglycan carboxypeptidase